MRTTGLICGAGTVLLLLLAGCPTEETGADDSVTGGASASVGTVPDQVIVNVVPGANPAAVSAAVAAAGGSIVDRLDAISAVLVEVDPDERRAAEASLGESPVVEGVAGNQVYEPDPSVLSSSGSAAWHLEAIDAPGAWNVTTGATSVLVAVLDTGVDALHPALVGRLVSGANVSDGVSGWSDAAGHGTAIASVIVGAQVDGAATTIGIAPGVRVLPVRVTDSKNVATSWSLAAGMAYAASRGAKVINISMAPTGAEADLFLLRQAEAARLRGSLVVMAIGNSGQRTSATLTDAVLFTGAVDQQLARASFSAYGPALGLVAPGVVIQAAKLGGGLELYDGTSLAAPLVAGVAALATSSNQSLRPSTLRGILESTAVDLGTPGRDESFGAGLVQALDAVNLARATTEAADRIPPTISFATPSDGATVSGLFSVALNITDSGDVADVALLVDGQPLATDSLSPYAFVVDADAFTARRHELAATASDVFGNSASARIYLDFATSADRTAPVFVIAAPAVGATLRGTVTLRVDASDDRQLSHCVFNIGGRDIASVDLDGEEAPAVHNWEVSSSGVATGDATLTAKVYDASGNVASQSIRVVISR